MTTRGTNGVVRSHSSPLRFRVATAWDILSDAIRNNQINGDDNQAAAIAFYAILSAIPFFILTLWIAGLVFGSSPDLQTRIIKTIQEFSPFFFPGPSPATWPDRTKKKDSRVSRHYHPTLVVCADLQCY